MSEVRQVVRREPSQFKRSPLHPDEWIMVGENTPYYWTHQQINETFIDADQYKAEQRDRVIDELIFDAERAQDNATDDGSHVHAGFWGAVKRWLAAQKRTATRGEDEGAQG